MVFRSFLIFAGKEKKNALYKIKKRREITFPAYGGGHGANQRTGGMAAAKPGFMIQGGCPDGMGTGGPGWNIPGEFSTNGFKNDLKHERGILSMARAMDPNSAGSQFFIMVESSPHLDGQYAAFGKVTEGMDAADKIVAVTTDYGDKPLEPQVMKKVSIIEE